MTAGSAQCLIDGKRIWSDVIGNLLGEREYLQIERTLARKHRYYSIENAPRVAAFGYSVGKCFAQSFAVDRDLLDYAATTVSLLNVSLSLFDKVCDLHSDMLPKLIDRVNRDALSLALSHDKTQTHDFPTVLQDDEAVLRVIFVSFREYSKRIRNLYEHSNRSHLWLENRNTLLALYDSELRSRDLRLSKANGIENSISVLRNKSSLLLWAFALVPLLCDSSWVPDSVDPLRHSILRVGDVFWIVDDIVDAAEDFRSSTCSYLWLNFLRKSGSLSVLDGISEDEALEMVVRSGTLEAASEDLCRSYFEGLTSLEKILPLSSNLDEVCLFWVKNWLGPPPGPAW